MEVARNPKGATVQLQFYQQPSVIACFEPIIDSLLFELQSQQADINFGAADLSLLIGQLQQFQQDCLGIHNKPTHAPLRIPAKLFKFEENKALTPDSAIYSILLAAYTYRIRNGWKKWDFNPTRKAKNAELIQSIRDLLQQRSFINLPSIGFNESVPESARKTLTSMAKKLQLRVCDNVRQASHILYGPLHEYEVGEEEWFRTLEKRENNVLVHWWYFPDSYDSWLPQTEQFADPEDAPVHHGAWHIATRWLQDSVKYNELMNEEDYEEVDAGEEESPEAESRQDSISEGPSDNITSSTIKSEALRQPFAPAAPAPEPVQVIVAPPVPVLNPESQPAVRIRDIERERPQLGSRQRKNEFEPYSNGDITNISQYTEEFMEGPAKEATSFMKLDSTDESNGLDLSKAVPYNENSFVGPSWFNMSEVSDVEKVALPEYFKSQGKKAERLAKEYKKYRNFMIEAYRKNPSYYLTFTACKNALNIDMLAVIRIHTFLEHAGLINQLVDPRRRLCDPFIDSEPDAEVRTTGTQRDFAINEPDIQFLRNLIYEEIPKQSEQSTWDVKVYDDLNVDGRSVFSCTNCHQDCTEIRYHSLKYKGLQLCVNCFLEGKFTATTWKGEFLRVDKNDREVPDDTWSEDEVLRLLEAIDRFDDDWLAISEHVGTRTKEQCITQFLQLPINDEFLTAKLSDKELEELPFGDQSNPVMTLIAFLSGHINPGIASFAAKRAIKELMDTTEEDPMDVDDESDYDDDEDEEDRSAFSRAKVKRATIAALESAVEHAKKLASYEHEEIQHWTRLVVKTLVDKLVIKIQQYDEQEIFLENELKELEKQGVALNTSLEALSKQYPPNNSVFGSASMPANTTPATTSTTTTPTIKQ